MNVISKNFTCNESIRERELRVIDSDGSQLGIISRNEALQMAEERDLDLVMISPTAVPPVCKIMDLGKYIYEQAKKEKEESNQTAEAENLRLEEGAEEESQGMHMTM